MTRTTRVSIQILPLLVAGLIAGVGCSSGDDNNKPAYTVTGGSPNTGTGGSPSAGTSTSSGGTNSTAGANGNAGSSAGASGDPCTAPNFYPDPKCAATGTGTDIAKGVACTATDTQLCDKNCGPGNTGYKTETCTGGVYAEGECTFPASCNFSCFQVPQADAAGCPATPPQHNQPCTLAICNLPCAAGSPPCEMCGVAQGYLDTSGTGKTGYCICIPAAAGGGKFACATTPSAWPCPNGAGC